MDFLFFICFNKAAVISDIDEQLTLIIFLICSYDKSSNYFISLVPTLLTRMPTSNFLTFWTIYSNNVWLEEFSKSNWIVMNFLLLNFSCLNCFRFWSVWLSFYWFLDIRQTSNPSCVKVYANPNPMPSVAPVTTAQHSGFDVVGWLYLLRISLIGRHSFKTFHKVNKASLISCPM